MNIQQRANSVARRYGYGGAAQITMIEGGGERVLAGRTGGYYKRSTGERVSNAYNRKAFSSCEYRCTWAHVTVVEERSFQFSGVNSNFVNPM